MGGRNAGAFAHKSLSFLAPLGESEHQKTVSSIRTSRSCPRNGFSLLELVLVVAIIGLVYVTMGSGFGSFARFRDRAYIGELVETLEFLHAQAQQDYEFYQIEFDLAQQSWTVGLLEQDLDDPVLNSASSFGGAASSIGPNAAGTAGAGMNAVGGMGALGTAVGIGSLSIELATFLNPPLGSGQSFVPPPAFPSLGEPHRAPGGMRFVDIRTPRGELNAESGERPYLIFSPRGFTEFGVIHLERSDQSSVTLVINSFTGEIDQHEGYREFEWTFEFASEGL
jgi:prepilin-type N-terminal cleavage/methylation domain-containing protein